MTRFRPCIDLHDGHVKQIVGGTLGGAADELETNHVSEHDAAWYAHLYRQDDLRGGHVIMLGPGNADAARSALAAWPGGLQIGGGINADNAGTWLDAGAEKVIVTSWLFPDATFAPERLERLAAITGRDRLVVDLSCRRTADGWVVATDKWRTRTRTPVDPETLALMAPHCGEFLIHAADVEGRCSGIDEDLVRLLGEASPLPCTYAGGARDLTDLDRVAGLSDGAVDLTFGSALDCFGGNLVRYRDCVEWNRRCADGGVRTQS